MKKILILCGLTMFILTSCEKNYSCKCVTVYESSLGIPPQTQTSNIKAKKSDAKAQCEGISVTSPGYYTTTCTLQ
jgi:hypothetical protein